MLVLSSVSVCFSLDGLPMFSLWSRASVPGYFGGERGGLGTRLAGTELCSPEY